MKLDYRKIIYSKLKKSRQKAPDFQRTAEIMQRKGL